MSTHHIASAQLGRGAPARSAGAAFADRWIFVFMAALFVATALAGFVPSSIAKLASVRAGEQGPMPPVLHVHAVLMGGWLALLLVQSVLVATGAPWLHRRLGMLALLVAPAMVLSGVLLVPVVDRPIHQMLAAPPAGTEPALLQLLQAWIPNRPLSQIRAGVVFAVLIAWALWVRTGDPQTHKRLLVLATVWPLGAGINRIPLPGTYPESPAASDLYTLLWVAPLFVYDLVRHRRVPRAWWIWLAVCLPLSAAVHLLWGSAWWMAHGPEILGLR